MNTQHSGGDPSDGIYDSQFVEQESEEYMEIGQMNYNKNPINTTSVTETSSWSEPLPYSTLALKYYVEKNDEFELRKLLATWHMSDLFDFFAGMNN